MADPTLDDDIPGFKYSFSPTVAPTDKVGVTVAPAPDIYKTMPTPARSPKPGPDIENLQPDLKERVDVLRDLWKNNKELNPKGEDLPITSGFRTKAEQEKFFRERAKNPNLVAPPGYSRHEKGDALDLLPDVPDSMLAQVGLHRPHGAKDPVHVEINPDLPFESKPYDVNADEEAPGFKFKYNPKKFTAAEDLAMAFEDMKKTPGKLAKTFASAADTALSGIPAAAQFVAEPVAKLVDRIGDTKVAEDALKKATSYFDRPIGKAFGITNDPVYNAEATHRLMDYVGENVDKGADWIAENTGMDKSDAAWFLNAAALKAAPTIGRAAKATGKAIHENVTAENAGNLLAEISGKMTNTSPFNTKRAYAAGFEKNPTILESSKEGAVSAPEIVNNVREAFQGVKERKSQAYKEGIATTKGNQVFLDFKPIREAFNETVESLKSKGVGGVEASKVGPETMNKVHEIEVILSEWERKPELHTAGGLDDLKQRIDDVYSQGMTDQAKRVMTATRNKVKDTISAQDPNYEKTMADYEQGLKLEREIQSALSLGPKTGVDTTIRKLAQVFSNKNTLSKEYRLELLQELERVGGKDIIDKLAGYAMGQATPSSLQLLADISVATGAHMISPEAGVAGATTLATLAAAQSPKIALHVAYGAGRTARALSDVGKTANAKVSAARAKVAETRTKLSELTSRK